MHSLGTKTFILVALLFVALATSVSSKSVHRHHEEGRGLRKLQLPEETVLNDATEEQDTQDEDGGQWLVDAIDYPVYDYQGDAPEIPSDLDNARCPPFPDEAPQRACRARVCKTDRDCRRSNQRCCFNGCRFTCTAEMTNPAVVDWQLEPRRQGQSGTSWLIKGPEGRDDVEPCTTTKDPDDGDPLLCPHGYMCHIIDPGDPENGVPNRGQCLKEKYHEQEIISKEKILKSDLRMSGRCLLWNKAVIRDQTIILLGDNKEKCKCHRGTIHCGDKFVSSHVSP